MATDTDTDIIRHGRLREFRAPTVQESPRKVEISEDGKTGIIRDVLVVGSKAAGMGVYSREVKAAAVGKFATKPTFVDHTKDGSNPGYGRKLGVHRNPRMSEEGIRTDFHFNAKHPVASQLIWDSENDPTNVGFSMDADCSWKRKDSNGRRIVESIDAVYGIDLVSRGGTVNGLFEEEGESIPEDQRDFAEHAFSSLDAMRAIILDRDSTLTQKRTRFVEEMQSLHGELLEGEIGDELAKAAPYKKMRDIQTVATGQMHSAMWDSEKFPQHHDKKNRHLAVLGDWKKELNAVQCNCPDCSGGNTKEERQDNMEWKDITLDSLKANAPELVAKLTGTDEQTRLTEELKTTKAAVAAKDAELATLKAEQSKRVLEETIGTELKTAKFPTDNAAAYSTRFQEQLRAEPDAAKRAEIISDRMALLTGRVQEEKKPGLPSPLAQFGDTTAAKTGADPSHDHLFGVKK